MIRDNIFHIVKEKNIFFRLLVYSIYICICQVQGNAICGWR